MERKPLLAANWKMNRTVPEAVALARELVQRIGPLTERDVLLAPPFPALMEVGRVLAGTSIALGAQNMHAEESGAFTGEVSAVMLLSTGCTHVILGHSERRQHSGETDAIINRKLQRALQKGLTPVFCIGETSGEREAGLARSVVGRQLQEGLKNLTSTGVFRIILAYEPVWAIGTGVTATPEQAQEMHGFIRDLLSEVYGAGTAESCRILYGGSVKSGNISSLMAEPDIDGALVGGASLDAAEFEAIVKFA